MYGSKIDNLRTLREHGIAVPEFEIVKFDDAIDNRAAFAEFFATQIKQAPAEASAELKNRLMSYVNHFDEILRIHRGLYLYGSIGVGKTFAAACIANELSRKHYRCIVTNFNRIVNSVWTREHRQEILDDLNSYDLLVIDDLGTEFDTKFIQSLVYEIIDNRYRMGLPLVITSNISYNSLEKTKSEFLRRAYSRIMEMCHPIEVVGINRRKFLAEEKVARFNKFLDGEM